MTLIAPKKRGELRISLIKRTLRDKSDVSSTEKTRKIKRRISLVKPTLKVTTVPPKIRKKWRISLVRLH